MMKKLQQRRGLDQFELVPDDDDHEDFEEHDDDDDHDSDDDDIPCPSNRLWRGYPYPIPKIRCRYRFYPNKITI